MKLVILAGGLGTRLAEETTLKPKPMVEIGGKPILWHIMKLYAHHGINDFIICAGYKGYIIKEYFSNYFLHTSDVTFDMSCNEMTVHHQRAEPWRVTVADTGESTMTGGRLKRVQNYLDDEPFCFTYGDGVGNVDVTALLKHHTRSGLDATLTGVQPPGRYGALTIREDKVTDFVEKPMGDNAWINGGFFVLSRKVFDYLAGDETVFEQAPLQTLARMGQLGVYRHRGFWLPMDTLRDKQVLQKLWDTGDAPWKTW